MSGIVRPRGELHEDLTFGQKLADKVAGFGGSWLFIIVFFSFMLLWMAVNIFVTHPFDHFPFILLNLLLSTLASIQAPIILMSQNRQADKDRKRAEYDYEVNLKAEAGVAELNEKLDRLMAYSIKIQEVQEEIMEAQEEIMEEVTDDEDKTKDSN